MEILLAIVLFVVGAVMGSFACCQAWRLHLAETKKKKEVVGSRWSVCLDCGYRLKWYDNIPVVSWIWLRGRCRKCGKKIGWWEIASEVWLGAVFVMFGLWFYFGFDGGVGAGEMARYWLQAGLVAALLTGLAVLLVSDARWGRLPVRYLTFCTACAMLYVATREWGGFGVSQIWGYLGALLMLPGLYYLLYKISGEKWVGSGDWLLALPIALVLGNFWLAFFCLFAANLLGCLAMVPIMMVRKKNMETRVPFGPFLVAGFVVVWLCQDVLLGLIV